MMEKEITGPQSAQYVLRDPTVEFAVETGEVYTPGLGFSICDIGIITNSRSGPGISDIHSLEDLK
jgi:cyanophycin synthetase